MDDSEVYLNQDKPGNCYYHYQVTLVTCYNYPLCYHQGELVTLACTLLKLLVFLVSGR